MKLTTDGCRKRRHRLLDMLFYLRGYQPWPELLERLTLEQRKIVQPIAPRRPPQQG